MTQDSEQATEDVSRTVVRRFAQVGVVVPAILTLAALASQFAWLPDTPDPLATHWSGSGPDGSGPGWTYPLITLFLGFGLSVWLWLSGLPRLRRGSRGWSFRFLAAIALGLSAFGAVSMSWSVAMQRGLESWTDAPSVLPAILVGAVVGLAAGAIGWVVQPHQGMAFDALPAARIELGSSERAVWVGAARASRGVVATMIIVIVLIVAGAVAAWIAGAFAAMWIMIGVVVLLGALTLTTLEADVRVDAAGVEVRGPAGFPRTRVPLAEVASATAITVEALGAYGGWGWRFVPGSMGVILRSGGALRVERTNGHALVVTVDDAATAAALLAALVARAAA